MLKPTDVNDAPAPAGGHSSASRDSGAARLRRLVGVTACIAFVVNLVMAQFALSGARESDASAIQIIQVWTPHIYYAILITGVAVALYIYSRALD